MKITGFSKVDAKAEIEAIARQLLDLKQKCTDKEIDVRPWVSHDHPFSVQHWRLVQRRIAFKEVLKKPFISPDRRQAASLRMTALQKARQKATRGAVSQCQTAE